MAERKWTEKQKQAIDTRNRTLLVSAAAGSGKTATLTERVIRSLMDENDPISVDSLLVVTFTNAAASELRLKITRALEDAIDKNPENKRLERQLFLLPEAKIRTIDSFCTDILRSNADRVGVPFNYRIADVSECELLAISVMDGLIEAVYSGFLPDVASPMEFEELADCLTDSKRTEELSEVLRYLYERCECDEKGIELLSEFANIYDPRKYTNVRSSLHGDYLFQRVREMCEHYINIMSPYKMRFSSAGSDYIKCYDMAVSDISAISSIFSEDYTTLRERLRALKLVTRPRVKEKTDDTESYAEIRDSFKEDLKKFLPFFVYTEDQWRNLYTDLYRLTSVLYRFLSKFGELYDREKLRRGSLSYADVERYAYKCLIKDGKPTDIADNIASSYSAIYIDEYQDVNRLQNSIFEAISKDNNRFMVGDIKQSIYGFRSARPEIFAKMKREFSPIDEVCGNEPASIFMSNNFRCDRAIVDFVNSVFDKAFALAGDSVGYLKDDGLVYSKIQEKEPEYFSPEICLLDKSSSDDEDYGSLPDVVAAKIEELLSDGVLNDGSPIKPSDIAILMRNSRGKDRLYAEALFRKGIPAKISGAKNFFLSAEVLLCLCLLNSIDNPRRDVYLAGLMCSPLYSFSADELYLVKSEGRDLILYDALVSYTENHSDFEKGKKILDDLRKYRTLSEGIGVSELLFRLYHETGLLALAAKCGGKENLMLLYDYSQSFEAGEFRGLYNFIHFINSLVDKRTTFDDARENTDESAVKIVTCHGSKGLEYPVVFLVDAGSRIRNKDTSKRIAYSDDMGIAFRLRTPSGLSLVNNPVIDIINHYGTRKNFEEELRVLYVALTRAREKMYIVGDALKDNREKYIEEIFSSRETLSSYSLYKLSSYLEIIIATTGKIPKSREEFVTCYQNKTEVFEDLSKKDLSFEKSLGSEGISELSKELLYRFTYEYPREYLTKLPEKMSVSKTSPTVLDGSDEGVFEIISDEAKTRRTVPSFISGSPTEESAKRGIATHYFMQFCNLENFARNGANTELSRLVSEGYISAADGERVRIRELEMFRESELFSDMREAKNLYRELRFNVRLPAENFTEDKERRKAYAGCEVLVQGVIDCIIEYPDGTLGLFDYKTDRLTKEELADSALAEKTLRDKHKTQLSYYAEAAERIFGKKPKKIAVYSLHLGDCVSME